MGAESNSRFPTLTTARLSLEPFAASDVSELLTLFQDRCVRRYLLDDQLVDTDWVRDELESSDLRFGSGAAGLWAIRRCETAPIIGFTGFRPFFDPPQLQLLYGLLPSWWGFGYATEAARAAIEFGFDVVGLEEVVGATDQPNSASQAVMRRLGMTRHRVTDDGEFGTVFYRLLRQR